jgi:hypothetical protein
MFSPKTAKRVFFFLLPAWEMSFPKLRLSWVRIFEEARFRFLLPSFEEAVQVMDQ